MGIETFSQLIIYRVTNDKEEEVMSSRIVLAFVIMLFVFNAYAEVEEDVGVQVDELANSIRELQPLYRNDTKYSRSMARWFLEAAEDNSFDPKLLVAISFRESSLRPSTIGTSHNEVGLMQVHGAAARLRPNNCTLESPRCQIRTGTAWLALARRQCGLDTWDYVFAYGTGRCPRTPEESRGHHSPRNARRHYIRIGGTSW
jgi:hypothetical protein